MTQHREATRRAIRWTALCVVAGLLAAGCSSNRNEPSDPAKLFGAQGVSATQAKQDYAAGMSQVQGVLDSPDSPPLQQLVSVGQKQALNAYAIRWDQATSMASQVAAPKDVAADHRQLVAAMKLLGDYNHRIAAAAPNKARVQRLAKAAENSVAAKQFNAALQAIGRKGYLDNPNASPNGLDGQSTLDGGGTAPETGGTPLDGAGAPNG